MCSLYIAYSYYRQGFGKVHSDDELFKKGLAEVEKVVELDCDSQVRRLGDPETPYCGRTQE
ncbi:MAG: hypothetical protein IPN69_14820 [Acidobacteria bacterium]|nr:hypothetical protein [Acidobacteriota bacterium]